MLAEPLAVTKIDFLFELAGVSTIIERVENISNGGNNRTYKVMTTTGVFAIKKYFRKSTDPRDRLYNEYKFLEYANRVAPQYVPKAFSKCDEEGMALYEYIDGSSIKVATKYEVNQALDFFKALNENVPIDIDLPNASEACFTLQEHLALVSKRVAILKKIDIECEVDIAAELLINKLTDKWHCIQSNIADNVSSHFVEHELSRRDRCISPSDFGFHNAFVTSNGLIKFFDFEYAGWDDPAKMIADFFSQLAVPIPKELFDYFSVHALSLFESKDELFARAKILYPVYQIKWCCIALNIFITEHLARRKFANPQLDVKAVKKTQLEKARVLLDSIFLLK